MRAAVSGVYCLQNVKTGKRYVGSSWDVHLRGGTHRTLLLRGAHHSIKLQRSWDKHGPDAFVFEILEVAARGVLTEREQFWIDALFPQYNIKTVAGGSATRDVSVSTRQKMRDAKLGKPMSASNRAALSAAMKGVPKSQEHRAKLRGRRHSEESLKRMSIAQKGRITPPDVRARIAESKRGVRPSAEALENLRAAGAKIPLETKARFRETAISLHSKHYIAVSPLGVRHDVFNLSEFCRERNLASDHLSAVATGKRRQSQGWVCWFADEVNPDGTTNKIILPQPKKVQVPYVRAPRKPSIPKPPPAHHPLAKRFIVESPEGEQFEVVNLMKFCRPLGLSSCALGVVATGLRNHHKGWRCRRADPTESTQTPSHPVDPPAPQHPLPVPVEDLAECSV